MIGPPYLCTNQSVITGSVEARVNHRRGVVLVESARRHRPSRGVHRLPPPSKSGKMFLLERLGESGARVRTGLP